MHFVFRQIGQVLDYVYSIIMAQRRQATGLLSGASSFSVAGSSLRNKATSV